MCDDGLTLALSVILLLEFTVCLLTIQHLAAIVCKLRVFLRKCFCSIEFCKLRLSQDCLLVNYICDNNISKNLITVSIDNFGTAALNKL